MTTIEFTRTAHINLLFPETLDQQLYPAHRFTQECLGWFRKGSFWRRRMSCAKICKLVSHTSWQTKV